MKCRDVEIQELLPAFSEQSLDPAEAKRVEAHAALCAECREELALLGMLRDETVPDPGGAYWSTMPDRVYRQVQEERRKQRGFTGRRLFPMLPRWAWASAAAAVLAIIAWFAFSPLPGVRGPVNGPDQTAFEEGLPDEQLDVADLDASELTVVTRWAENQYAPIGEALEEELSEGSAEDLADELGSLDTQELDRILNVLRKKEQDARDKALKGARGKGIG